MNSIPSGTVTFLFTDIEGSTPLWQGRQAAMQEALARHHALIQQSIEAHAGYVFQIIGDACCAAFATAADALAASMDAQRALQACDWGETRIAVRMGLHTGSAELHAEEVKAGQYVSNLTLVRAQRVMACGHGGQILLSSAVAELLRGQLPSGVVLRDMGEHRLKGLLNPEHLWQVIGPGLWQDFPPLDSLNTIPNNLPLQLTSFIGREHELAELKRVLTTTRLLSLTGAGGTGKTRLSLQLAAEVLGAYQDGVWFVELAAFTDPSLLPQAVALVLGIHEEPGRRLAATIGDYLRDRQALLMLDNCEHLIESSARLVDALLHACPHLHVLCSSREPLGIAGEVVYRVPSLAVPDPARVPAVSQLTQYESVKLFIERAVAVQAAFAVTNANAPAAA